VFLRKVDLVSSGYVPVAQKSNKYLQENPAVVVDPFGGKVYQRSPTLSVVVTRIQ
jgi:hypothetical protein